jgi:hypothetical protein
MVPRGRLHQAPLTEPKPPQAPDGRTMIQNWRLHAMPHVVPSKYADAKLVEKDAWQRYAGARDDNWREAFYEWRDARDAAFAVWADEFAGRGR